MKPERYNNRARRVATGTPEAPRRGKEDKQRQPKYIVTPRTEQNKQGRGGLAEGQEAVYQSDIVEDSD